MQTALHFPVAYCNIPVVAAVFLNLCYNSQVVFTAVPIFDSGNLTVDILVGKNIAVPGERCTVDHADSCEIGMVDMQIIAPVRI